MVAAFDAPSFLRSVAQQPGVYRMYNAEGDIIYVGKAKNLHKRLSSYFRKKVDGEKTRALVSHIAQIEVTVTHTETEALILEHNLIKQHRPRYNVLLRDDKSYPYIFLSQDKHPRLSMHRGLKRKKGHYFGPYPDGGAVRESLHLLQRIIPIRQCDNTVYANRQRPCLLYQINRCVAPCVSGYISDSDYDELVQMVQLFLQGKDTQLIADLVAKMEAASQTLAFERAAKLRDQIKALRRVQEQQYVAGRDQELDALGLSREKGMVCIHLLMIRQGQVLGSRSFFPKMPSDVSNSEVLASFMSQYYLDGLQGRALPDHILLIEALDEQQGMSEAISQVAGRQVQLQSQPRGERARYLKLAQTNAESALQSKLSHRMTMKQRFDALAQTLGMETITRMECFDISHTMGEKTVASCVVFNEQGPMKAEYRRYNITGITGGDDYAAMAQVLARRYGKQQDPDKIPDIIWIDGGKGQLNRALEIVVPLMQDWPKQSQLIGIAKGVTRKAGLETLIFADGRSESLPADAPALHLIQHIRDESHNHAIGGHRAARAKVRRTSTLEEIEGIGAKRRQQLLTHMGGLQELKKASVEEIAKVPGISRALAQKVFDALQH
ncbi:UvrABC system protein C [Vibrio stylophorae]|uniref:UvrABC system protein C n=1 Tax=Vibrio stylophorae TaxID=659351 RepID=A0ABM8ZS53_9VIBR|nr:excinuclease ABC subunit UvrC [Vibrio stylophorae]CAH0533131.1 UvrABC system protein C [Vibrio stylophorae]